MLKRWSLGGFKSFDDLMSLDIAPITIFAGSNSSGKSTILQSILLLKQTLQYGSPNRPLALNGPLLRLGSFDDVIHFNRHPRSISIDFSFEIDPSLPFGADRVQWLSQLHRSHLYGSEAKINRINGSFVWEPRHTSGTNGITIYDKLQSTLKHGELRISHGVSKEAEIPADKYIAYTPQVSNVTIQEGEEESPLNLTITGLDDLTREEIIGDKPDASIAYMFPNYFLPGWVAVYFNATKKRAHDLAEAVLGSNSLLSRTRLEGELLPLSLAGTVNNWLAEKNEPPVNVQENGISAAELNERLQPFRLKGFGRLTVPRRNESDLRSDDALVLLRAIETAIYTESGPNWEIEPEMPRSLMIANEFLRAYFRFGVRYLGPLRDEPKPVYPPEALENTTDVGYHGEHTAAVLYLHGSTNIRFVGPKELNNRQDKNIRTASLRNATSESLQYMGIATDVLATDAGVFGNQLQVITEGLSKKHDLTNVGVGVS
jgi:hypothetical protein